MMLKSCIDIQLYSYFKPLGIPKPFPTLDMLSYDDLLNSWMIIPKAFGGVVCELFTNQNVVNSSIVKDISEVYCDTNGIVHEKLPFLLIKKAGCQCWGLVCYHSNIEQQNITFLNFWRNSKICV